MRSIVTVSTPAASYDLTSRERVKRELGITNSDSDEKLDDWITQASSIAARYCGRVLVKETLTETFRLSGPGMVTAGAAVGVPNATYGYPSLTMSRYPIVSVASITVDGTVVDSDEYEFQGETDIQKQDSRIYRLTSSGYPTTWVFGKSVVVVYDAGYTPLAPSISDLERAVIKMVRDFRAATLRDDPNLRRRRTEGVSELEWWVPVAGSMVLPVEISGLLDQFRRKWGYMS